MLHAPRSPNFLSLVRPNNIWLLPYSWAQKSVRALPCTRFSTQRSTNTSFLATNAYELFLEQTWSCPKNNPTTFNSPLTQPRPFQILFYSVNLHL
jgi:hypothetical protein